MAWSFTSDKPVYLQIAERITASVLSGEYKPGEQIPTVRQLAIKAAVNPNTIQHAFTELEKNGLIEAHGTVGRYVTKDTSIIESCRKQLTEHIVCEFIKKCENLSISKQELIDIIEEVSTSNEHSRM